MTRFLNLEEFSYMLQSYEGNPSTKWHEIFDKLYQLFDATPVNCYAPPSGDPPVTRHLLPYYTAFNDFIYDVLVKHGHRYIYKKFEGNTTRRVPSFDSYGNITFTEQHVSDLDSFLDIELFVRRMINGWVERNSDRVIRTLSAAELYYDPIENYDRQEDIDETSTGSKTHSREMTEDYNPDYISVNAPISAVSIDSNLKLDGVTPTAKTQVETFGNGASSSDTQNAKTAGTVTAGEIGATATSAAGTEVTSTEQVTTYDDDTEHDNRKVKSEGDVANNTVSAAYSKTDIIGSVTITKNNPEQYKETDAFENFGTNINGRVHGNIGVTTTQQMIEQEYILRNKRLVDNFINECMNELFLQCGA